MQAEPSPKRLRCWRRACSRWIVMRVPLAASGCPMAIAPPCTLVLTRSSPNSRSTARYCGANASFTSTRSICSSFIPAFWSALRAAGAGPIPMYLGSTPATAQATSRPSGFRPRALVHVPTCELVPLRQVLRRLGHREAALRILEGFPQQILERRRAEPQAPTGAPHHVRRLAHRLRPPREHGARFAEQDQLCRLSDRLEPGAAQPVHSDGRHFDREPGVEADVAGEVDRVGGGLERVAEHRMADLPRGDA